MTCVFGAEPVRHVFGAPGVSKLHPGRNAVRPAQGGTAAIARDVVGEGRIAIEDAPALAWVDLGVMLLVSVALLPVVRGGGRISRGEGAVLLAIYLGYTFWLLRHSAA